MTVLSGQLSDVGDNTVAKLMSGKIFVWLLATVLLGTVSAEAQQPKNIPRVGFLGFETGNPVRFDAFRQGMRELGYVDGKNVVIERRSGNRLAELAAELVRLKVDVIVTDDSTKTQAAKDA